MRFLVFHSSLTSSSLPRLFSSPPFSSLLFATSLPCLPSSFLCLLLFPHLLSLFPYFFTPSPPFLPLAYPFITVPIPSSTPSHLSHSIYPSLLSLRSFPHGPFSLPPSFAPRPQHPIITSRLSSYTGALDAHTSQTVGAPPRGVWVLVARSG
ncbi:hypothetical protein E2C01_092510 [Portunus trituberculatus]|uniref:Uncharacterized protein n=1 Tax=Portunus trituberculatus TaxID=210409 RepID=A0A5B7JQR6_PORTR|nr:hypothetical protein [Portunus trituberculatus]